jgi:hypothetical protein
MLTDDVKSRVRKRAAGLCEYCHTDETWQYVPFTMDHVLPVSLGGDDALNNLALACFHCNRRKSNTVNATDPETGEVVRLFNPRLDDWALHFIWSADGLTIIPRTSVARATIAKLELNRERVIRIRAEDRLVGRHPPKGDPIQAS